MKVVLIGTNHSKREEDIEVIIEYVGDDDWTFEFGHANITVSDLTLVMNFLKSAMKE